MIDHVFRDLQALQKADLIIGRVWLKVLARRLGFVLFAALVAVFGLGMANVAAFYALQPSMGSPWAAAVIAGADLALALVLLLIGTRARPGPEIDIAFEVRKMALESLQDDARELKREFDSLGQELRNARANFASMMHHPLDAAAQRLIVPAILSIIKHLRASREPGDPAP